MLKKTISLALILHFINCELKFVTELFRHGARNKIFQDVENQG